MVTTIPPSASATATPQAGPLLDPPGSIERSVDALRPSCIASSDRSSRQPRSRVGPGRKATDGAGRRSPLRRGRPDPEVER